MEKNLYRLNARSLFLMSTHRFDLIFKLGYLENYYSGQAFSSFQCAAYDESIRIFNNFYEAKPLKKTKDDFTTEFHKTFSDIARSGYRLDSDPLMVTKGAGLYDGAHRLACAAWLGKEVLVELTDDHAIFDYAYFMRKGLHKIYADWGAMKYLRLNHNAYAVTIHSCVSEKIRPAIEQILLNYGRIFYRKDLRLTEKGYCNLKKLSYSGDDAKWVGDSANSFAGAREHARNSFGPNSLSLYIYHCDNLGTLNICKHKIRELVGLGNYSIHASDSHAESIDLAGALLNENSIFWLENAPINLDFRLLKSDMHRLNCAAKTGCMDLKDVCVVGSFPMKAFGIREVSDIDCVVDNFNGAISFGSKEFDVHNELISLYGQTVGELLYDPRRHFYLFGMKIMTLSDLILMKKRRSESPKDREDIRMIQSFLFNAN